ncbi:MAG TPA: bifunctional 5,10-methylenetetrahydrofolate dehydrogenase/5,10-methenyltetrahydrofolate cyclohydrolase [Acidobacteriota bacterium]|nr:bifunctional 5,10-methylenetetrahydrofolate dehydrogenase/5,10-methenyltetrahydrofolate cyclohydrolase [Acidobacteriota bacterium]
MSAKPLLGKPVQEAILAEVSAETADFVGAGHAPPHLTAVLVGEDPASAIYVRSKTRKCNEVGFGSEARILPESTSTNDLLTVVHELNADDSVDGILVQLPLPSQCDTKAILDAVDPLKDVDGFHAENAGRLIQGRPRFAPATPAGIIELLERSEIALSGKHAVVIGRSDIVGKPMAMLLLQRHATVTICHSRTPDLAAVARGADILVAAVGRPGLVTPDFVKPGATVIDVGINRVTDRDQAEAILGDATDWSKYDERGYVVVGDVRPDVAQVAGALTPVPGGVGPLTIGMLLVNTLNAARWRRGTA